ncbi:MAG: hypothetical protein BAA04_07670 [Firmicutes bacterium ZCTH02-B6]|nr:MAG: hypothetical protein BAA04_07670 [Firmicutes bacterium ZCTH02-B6]
MVLRCAALGALWLVLARQIPAVTQAGVLAEPAQRVAAAVGAQPERVTLVASAALPEPGDVTMAGLKQEAQALARQLERRWGVQAWRLGNRVEDVGRLVFLDGRTRTGGQLRVVAWHAAGGHGVAVAVVEPGTTEDMAAVRRRLVRDVARTTGMRPSQVQSGVEVRAYAPGKMAAEVEAALRGDRTLGTTGERWAGEQLPVAVAGAATGTRLVLGTVAAGPAELDVLGDVVW